MVNREQLKRESWIYNVIKFESKTRAEAEMLYRKIFLPRYRMLWRGLDGEPDLVYFPVIDGGIDYDATKAVYIWDFNNNECRIADDNGSRLFFKGH